MAIDLGASRLVNPDEKTAAYAHKYSRRKDSSC